jgi:hypothetical protein
MCGTFGSSTTPTSRFPSLKTPRLNRSLGHQIGERTTGLLAIAVAVCFATTLSRASCTRNGDAVLFARRLSNNLLGGASVGKKFNLRRRYLAIREFNQPNCLIWIIVDHPSPLPSGECPPQKSGPKRYTADGGASRTAGSADNKTARTQNWIIQPAADTCTQPREEL